jgi:hypothetical protein
MPTSQKAYWPTTMSPATRTASLGSGEAVTTCWAPYFSCTAWVSTVSSPRVAMTRASGLAPRSGRSTRWWVSTPSTAEMSTAAISDSARPWPRWVWSS